MKFLVIAQDLRISGTSEGVVSRSFIAKLRGAYPNSIINVVYLKQHGNEDQLDLLPVNSIVTHLVQIKIPLFIRWCNKLYWRLFHLSLNDRYVQNVYSAYMTKIDYENYDHIFIRSSGLDFECILGAKNLPILKKSIINFHDPYPLFWCAGNKKQLDALELFRLKEMYKVVSQAKKSMSPAQTLSKDMELLYGNVNLFNTLPHQYDSTVFEIKESTTVRKREKKLSISYQGAIQFGRSLDFLLDAYRELINSNALYKEHTEFVVRLKKAADINYLSGKFINTSNIIVLGPLSFSDSAYEQMHYADINVIVENGPVYCNILVGKAPFLASLKKPILSISPVKSELRRIVKEDKYIANCNDYEEIKLKLENLMKYRMASNEPVYPFGNYFGDVNFKTMLDKVLFET